MCTFAFTFAECQKSTKKPNVCDDIDLIMPKLGRRRLCRMHEQAESLGIPVSRLGLLGRLLRDVDG